MASAASKTTALTVVTPSANDVLAMLKQGVKGGGSAQRSTFYVKADQTRRVRFLGDLSSAAIFNFHENWDATPAISTLCWQHFDRDDCPYCAENVKVRQFFCWSVFDYEAGAVQIFRFKATKASPVKYLLSFFEAYGNITDRDYSVARIGTGLDTQYTVVPMDKGAFRPPTKKVVAFTPQGLLDALAEEFIQNPADREALFGSDDDDLAPEEEDATDAGTAGTEDEDVLFADDGEDGDFEVEEEPPAKATAKKPATPATRTVTPLRKK